jgi:methylthioribose-1-phosphate isomerase
MQFFTFEDTMRVNGKKYHSLWLKPGQPELVEIIDQRFLPFRFVTRELHTLGDACSAIREMQVRGAPLIGVTAAFGIYLALTAFRKGEIVPYLHACADELIATRPTAVNLNYAVHKVLQELEGCTIPEEARRKALAAAQGLLEAELKSCRRIGEYGLTVIESISRMKKQKTVNILTHCNAGWLACIDYGTATAPIYAAHEKGIDLHVWVDETRPRNQGARLTAWELGQEGIPHTVIVDNAGGHLMQHGMVDLVIVGSDRTTRTGDVANKIGTYLKALAAFDNHIPFYVALPTSSIDRELTDGISQIPIEERTDEEVRYIEGWNGNDLARLSIVPEESNVMNYGFDVTPARLVTGLITESGICAADEKSIRKIFGKKL